MDTQGGNIDKMKYEQISGAGMKARLEFADHHTYNQDDRSFDELLSSGDVDMLDIAAYDSCSSDPGNATIPWRAGLTREIRTLE